VRFPFNDNYDHLFFPVSNPPFSGNPLTGQGDVESRPMVRRFKYPVKPASVPAWLGGGADVTIEWKLAFHNGAGGHLWLSEKPDFRLVQLGTTCFRSTNDYNTQ